MKTNPTSTNRHPRYIKQLPLLIQAAQQGDLRTMDLTARIIINSLKKKYPEVAEAIQKILSTTTSVLRDNLPVSIPVDRDSQLELMKVKQYSEPPEQPQLNPSDMCIIDRFIRERQIADDLAKIEEAPPSTIVFTGAPGVGKTMTARWIAYILELPLIEVDLATVVSSYLGKTGQNIREVINFAQQKPSILFLDEFDALAKMRDDRSDLGELKRLVNVLLKEIEAWPSRGVIIAATNHPRIIDPAIWRRFDVQIDFSLPLLETRQEIITSALSPLSVNPDLSSFAAKLLANWSGSDLVRLIRSSKRYAILNNKRIEEAMLAMLSEPIKANWNRELALQFIKLHRTTCNDRLSNVFYATLFGKSEGTIRSLLKGKSNEKEK